MAQNGPMMGFRNGTQFGKITNLTSHKALPHRRSAEDKLRSEDANRIFYGTNGDRTPTGLQQELATASDATTSNGTRSGLPPTPPAATSLESAATAGASAQDEIRQAIPTLTIQRSSISTPIGQRSPPTPDPSPPRTKVGLSSTLPHPPVRYPSSRAESFVTAREEQWSSTSEASRSQASLNREASPDELDSRYVKHSPSMGLGLDFLQPPANIRSSPRHRSVEKSSSPSALDNPAQRSKSPTDAIPDREWNTELMRNVTVRRKNARPVTPPQQIIDSPTQSLQSSPSAKKTMSLQKRMVKTRERARASSAGNDSIGPSSWSDQVASALNRHIDESGSKRSSTASTSSTVVEAIVMVTPPQKRQGLRHAGKNLALRAASDSQASPSMSHAVIARPRPSEGPPKNRLVHKRSPIPEKRHSASLDPETTLEPSSNIVAHASEGTRSPRPMASTDHTMFGSVTPTEPQLKQRSVSSPAQNLYPSPAIATTMKRGYFDVSNGSSPSEANSSPMVQYVSNITPLSESSPKASPKTLQKSVAKDSPIPPPSRSRVVSAPLSTSSVLGTITARRSLTPSVASDYSYSRRPMSSSSRLRDVTTASTPRARPVIDQQAPSEAEQTRNDSGHGLSADDEIPTASSKVLRSFLDSPAPSDRRSPAPRNTSTFLHSPVQSEHRSIDTGKDTSVFGMTSDTVTLRSPPSIAATEDAQRASIDDTGFQRVSMVSTVRTDEYAMARHNFQQNTPFSQFSATPDAELNEATAVNLYPHTNHSLLVVQQVARSNPVSQRTTTTVEPNQPDLLLPIQPLLTFEPSTPPHPLSLETFHQDSPLTNPRTAPTPPAFKIIPPTPMEELDVELVAPSIEPESRPPVTRRATLRERARRYSDNLIAPILARTPSTRRRATSNPPNRRVPSVAEDDSKLHPFWRPRGFWDGFDDSESEDSDFDDDDDEHDDRIPPRTQAFASTDTGPKLPLGRRLTNGFKGSGGFLIGNTLGVSRSGTNNRRHHISLPAHLDRKVTAPPTGNGWRYNKYNPTSRLARTSGMRSTHPALNPLGQSEKRIGGLYSQQNSSFASNSGSLGQGAGARERGSRWKKVHRIPGLGVNVQYVGIRGMAEKVRERKKEKRREAIRKSIGPRVVNGSAEAVL